VAGNTFGSSGLTIIHLGVWREVLSSVTVKYDHVIKMFRRDTKLYFVMVSVEEHDVFHTTTEMNLKLEGLLQYRAFQIFCTSPLNSRGLYQIRT